MHIRNILYFFLLGIGLLSSACRKEDLPVKPQPSPFSATADVTAPVPAAGAKLTINITAGADGWWIVVPATAKDWCLITKIYGSGNFSLPVTIQPNTTGASRNVEVTVNPTFNLPPVKLVFNQQG